MSLVVSRARLDKLSALRSTDVFGGIPDNVLLSAIDSSVTRRINRGEILYSEHDEASAIYVVARGRFRSIRLSRSGKEQVLSTEGPGSVLAAVAVFDGGKFYSTVIADTLSEVLVIAKRNMLDLCRRYPELLWNVSRMLAWKLRHSAEVIETLSLRQVDQRVAQYLLTVCEQRGSVNQSACQVELTMNRSEIASRLGSTREVVSRAFSQLEKAGLIKMEGSRLVMIPDRAALRAFAGSDSSTLPHRDKRHSAFQLSRA
jgi:CRP/FNR family transcriptional regulator